jgi:hypothetical protein
MHVFRARRKLPLGHRQKRYIDTEIGFQYVNSAPGIMAPLATYKNVHPECHPGPEQQSIELHDHTAMPL